MTSNFIDSMRVDEGRKGKSSRENKRRARSVVWMGEIELATACDPGSELRLRGGREKRKTKTTKGMKKKKGKKKEKKKEKKKKKAVQVGGDQSRESCHSYRRGITQGTFWPNVFYDRRGGYPTSTMLEKYYSYIGHGWSCLLAR